MADLGPVQVPDSNNKSTIRRPAPMFEDLRRRSRDLRGSRGASVGSRARGMLGPEVVINEAPPTGATAKNFRELLTQSRKLNTQIDHRQLPKIERGVAQIDKMSRHLVDKSLRGASSEVPKSKAQYLLAGKGFDADRLSRDLQAINLRTAFEPLDAIPDTDIEGFLQHHRNMNILTAVQEAKRETVMRFNETSIARMRDAWDDRKRRLMDEFGVDGGAGGAGGGVADMDATQYQKSLNAAMTGGPGGGFSGGRWGGGPGFIPGNGGDAGGGIYRASLLDPAGSLMSALGTSGTRGRSSMTAKMKKYSTVLYKLNEKRLEGEPYGVVSELQAVAEKLDDRLVRRAEIVDCWRLLAFMLDEKSVRDGAFQAQILSAGQFEDAYAQSSPDLSLQFVRGAKAFLEDQYKSLIVSYVRRNAESAMRGGVPGLRHSIAAYLNVKFAEDPPQLDERIPGLDIPVWPMVYYALRCGDLGAAREIVSEAAAVMGNFPGFFDDYCANGGRLSDDLLPEMARDYKHTASRSQDVYKKACYIVVGRTETQKLLKEVFVTTQDFMWWKLSLVHPHTPAAAQYEAFTYTVGQLRDLIQRFGAAYFNPDGKSPLLYFQILLMSQQFEEAVAYLFAESTFTVEAIHVAAALTHYGALKWVEDMRSPLLVAPGDGDDDDRPAFNFGKAVHQYARGFAMTNAREALQYFFLLRSDARLSSVRDLVIESGEFDTLVGKVLPNGQRRDGAISKFLPAEDVVAIVVLAAQRCEETGRYADAIRLYFLGEDYDAALALLNAQMAQSVAGLGGGNRAEVRGLAGAFVAQIQVDGRLEQVRDRDLVDQFELLQNLMDFNDLARDGGKDDEALDLLYSLALLPDSDAVVDEAVSRFRNYPPALLHIVSQLMLKAMQMLYKRFQVLRASSNALVSVGDPGRSSQMELIRGRAAAIATFCGMVQFNIASEVGQEILRLEVLMQ